MLANAVLSLLFFYDKLFPVSLGLVLTALAWSFFFVSITLLQMFSLKHVNANVLFPLTTTLSLITVVIIGLAFFKDSLTMIQSVGILLIIAVVYTFLRKNEQIKLNGKFIIVGLGLVLFSATHKSIQKIAVNNYDLLTYMIYQYITGFILVAIFALIYHKRDLFKSVNKENALIGSITGVVSFLGGLAILKALSIGPFALIFSIHSTYILITAIVTALFFKEKLTKRIFLLTLIAIIGIILIKIG